MRCLLLLVLALLAAAAADAEPVLRTVTGVPTGVSSGGGGGGGESSDELYCDGWRLSVETGNAGPWTAIPPRCLEFVRAYMEGERYASDSAVAAADSLAFAARALASGGGGARPAWVFDVDETLLTNAPYYAVNGWGWVHSPCISLPFLYCSCTKLKRFAKQRVAIFVFTGEILPLIERVVRKFCVLCYSCKLRSCENYLY